MFVIWICDFLKMIYDITVHDMPSQATIPEYLSLGDREALEILFVWFFNSNKNNTLFIFHKL